MIPSHVRSCIVARYHVLKTDMWSKVRLKNAGSEKSRGFCTSRFGLQGCLHNPRLLYCFLDYAPHCRNINSV